VTHPDGQRRYSDKAEWAAAAKAKGYEGPYHVQSSNVEQYVYPEGGTAAIWNVLAGSGWVFG
jgi:hypothetical protein